MTALATAGRFLKAAPREAMWDLLGLLAIGAIVFSGFVLPGLL